MNSTFHSRFKSAIVALLLVTVGASAAVPFTLRFATDGDLVIPFDPAESDFAYQIGFRTDADVGYDANDIPVPTVVPIQPGAVVFFMTASDPSIGGYSQDFRPVSESQAWQLNFLGLIPGSQVTLQWRLEDGNLDGNAIKLFDGKTETVLVEDMTVTTSITFNDEDQELLLLYGEENYPPLAEGDEFYMLQADGSIAIPTSAIMDNDFDPNPDDSIEFVGVGIPQLTTGGGPPKAGTSVYGTTTYDDVNKEIIYSLPGTLPPDWDGTVAFEYTITDDFFLDPLQGSATILVHIAPTITQEPVPARQWAAPGASETLTYTLRYEGTLHSLELRHIMPMRSVSATPIYWLFGGGYADDAAGTPDPVIGDGAGPDGILGTEDDLGMVVLDFGTDVPPSGTQFSFAVDIPVDAEDSLLQSAARYRVSGTEEDPFEQRFEPKEVHIIEAVSFVGGTGGTISGDTPQYPEPGQDTTAVTAVPDAGSGFLRWTADGETFSLDNPLTVTGDGQAWTITAEFVDLLFSAERDMPGCAEPGETVSVDIIVTQTGADAVTAFSITETLPATWEFEGVTSTPAPDVSPAVGATGTVTFTWGTVPSFPLTLSYDVSVPGDATGPVVFDGTVTYATTGAEIPVAIAGDSAMDVGDCCVPHDADQNENWQIEIAPEISRIVQFFNSGGYHCQAGTEDGFAPGPGDESCDPHSADQNGNWQIEIAPEISRIVQFFNSGGYRCQDGTEDGYAPGMDTKTKAVTDTTVTTGETLSGEGASTADEPATVRSRTRARQLAGSVTDGGDRMRARSTVIQGEDTPDGMVDVGVTLDHAEPGALTALILEQSLPEGWAFVELLDQAAVPYVAPEAGDTGDVMFGWVTIPQEWPLTLRIRLAMPDSTAGAGVIDGAVTFREQAGARRVALPDITVMP